MKNCIVAGIDVSKNFSDMCILGVTNDILKELHFNHDEQGLHRSHELLLEIEANYGGKPVIIMESTGHYHRLPYYFFRNLGYECIVVNPLQTNAIKNISIRKIKSDKVDAYRIAFLYRLQDFETTNMPVDILFDMRNLTRQHCDLIKTRTMYNNQLVAVLDQAFPSFKKVFRDLTTITALTLLEQFQSPQQLLLADRSVVFDLILKLSRSGKRYAERKTDELYAVAEHDRTFNIESKSNAILIRSMVSVMKVLIQNTTLLLKEIQAMIASDETVKHHVELISTIPGIGWFGAAVFLCEIGDFSKFKKPSQLVAYCGIDPSQRQSGMYKGTKNKISKRGCRYIRRQLNMSAIAASHKNGSGVYNNPVLAEYYQKKCISKPKKVAMCAVMNKLIHLVYAVLRDQKPFELRSPENHAELLHLKNAA